MIVSLISPYSDSHTDARVFFPHVSIYTVLLFPQGNFLKVIKMEVVTAGDEDNELYSEENISLDEQLRWWMKVTDKSSDCLD